MMKNLQTQMQYSDFVTSVNMILKLSKKITDIWNLLLKNLKP
jgi:hypothetical protein